MADAQDLKSWDCKKSCGFKSHHRHQLRVSKEPAFYRVGASVLSLPIGRTLRTGQGRRFIGQKKHPLRSWLHTAHPAVTRVPLTGGITLYNVANGVLLRSSRHWYRQPVGLEWPGLVVVVGGCRRLREGLSLAWAKNRRAGLVVRLFRNENNTLKSFTGRCAADLRIHYTHGTLHFCVPKNMGRLASDGVLTSHQFWGQAGDWAFSL